MCELHGESLEGVALRDVVLDGCLEFLVCEGLTRYTLEFVVG